MDPSPPRNRRPTFVFTDIVDSAKMASALGHARYVREMQRPHDEIVRNALAQSHGYEDSTSGDSFFLAFESAQDALECVLSVQKRLHENPITTVDTRQRTWTLALRIGVHTAERDVAFDEETHYRSVPDVNFAARLQGLSSPEQILVSAETYRAVLGTLHNEGPWQAWPDRWIKSFEDAPQTLYELLWDGTRRAPPGAQWMPKFLLRETGTFIGRDAYMEEIVQWLKSDRPLLLLHGVGGIGKTRLAAQASIAVASHYQGRIFGVALDAEFPMQASSTPITSGDLAQRIAMSTMAGDVEPASGSPGAAPVAGMTDVTPTQLALRIAMATEAPEEVLNDATAERVIADLERRFADKPFLLVLDNFESVNNAETRAFLGALAHRVRKVRCLVTCRTHFDISPFLDSREVTGLAIPASASDELEPYEGYQLFRDRAGQAAPPRDLSDVESLIRILQATEGSALGIELIAARYRLDATLSLKAIAEGLQVSLLKWQRTAKELGATHVGPWRQESVEASIDWSLSLLPEQERALFPHLGVYPADFDAEAAQGVAGISPDFLTRWVLAHLVQADATRGRFTLQPVVREFAEKRLPADETDALRDRFAAYYALLAAHNDDLNDATKRTVVSRDLRNLYSSADYLHIRPSLGPDDALRLVQVGRVLWRAPTGLRSENVKRAIACLDASLRVYTEADFSYDWAMTQTNLGTAYTDLPTGNRAENLKRAIACYDAALRIRTEADFPYDWARTQNNLGTAYTDLPTGDRAENVKCAIACFESALRVYTEADFPSYWASTQNNLTIARRLLAK